MLAVLVTLIVVASVLVVLFMNVACTGLFVNARPTGDRGVGLIVPLFGLAGSVVALTFAAVLSAFCVNSSAVGVVGGLGESPLLAGVLVVVLTFGAAVSAGMAFMLWCEPVSVARSLKRVTVPLGIVLGVCGPVILAAMLLVGVWMPKAAATEALASGVGGRGLALRAGFVAVCVLAAAGYGLGGAMLWRDIRWRVVRRAGAVAAALKERARWRAEGRKAPSEYLAEELSLLSDGAPLSAIVGYLPDRPDGRNLDAQCRAMVIDRALRVADLDAGVVECMRSRQYIDRQGAAEFLAGVRDAEFAAHRDAWGRALVVGLEATGEGIYCRPAWCSETFDSNPDPLGHVRSLLDAADRFKGWSEHGTIRDRLQKMADDASMLKDDSRRRKLLRMLADAGYRASSGSQ